MKMFTGLLLLGVAIGVAFFVIYVILPALLEVAKALTDAA